MNISTLFRLEENLNLDRKTLIILRWIAIAGQFSAINLVYFVLKLNFPILIAYFIVFIGFLTNLFLQIRIKSIQLKDFYSAIFLIYDLIQLSLLLYLTGGISNPFSILMIIPTIVSSTFLSMGTTLILGILTVIFLFLLTIFHHPLPGIHDGNINFPKLYLIGYFIAIIIGLIFLSYFGVRFSGESKRRSDAVIKLQQVIAKEYELETLGGQAAAAAHSLGTPLATINVVASELKKDKHKQHIAVIGDGSMTGGIAFEGLNHAGMEDTNLLIILNDNCMSIDPGVGALKEYLTDIATSRTYNRAKNKIWKILGKISKFGPNAQAVAQKVEGAIKSSILGESNYFESLNFRYFGPIDGHDVEHLYEVLKDLKSIPGPKILLTGLIVSVP